MLEIKVFEGKMGRSLANNEIGCTTFVKASHKMVEFQMKSVNFLK